MTWHIQKLERPAPWAVIDTPTGRMVSCHHDRGDADRALASLMFGARSGLRPKVPEYISKGPSVPISTAHLLHTIGYNVVHAMRHLDEASNVDKKPGDRMFDIQHAQNHIAEAQEHVIKLSQHLEKNYPAEGAELKKMDDETYNIVPDNHAEDHQHGLDEST